MLRCCTQAFVVSIDKLCATELLRTAREDAFALIDRDPRLLGEGACVLESLLRRHGDLLTGPPA